jgi:hypothetical protein
VTLVAILCRMRRIRRQFWLRLAGSTRSAHTLMEHLRRRTILYLMAAASAVSQPARDSRYSAVDVDIFDYRAVANGS